MQVITVSKEYFLFLCDLHDFNKNENEKKKIPKKSIKFYVSNNNILVHMYSTQFY